MTRGKGRRQFSREFKARVAMDALRNVDAVSTIAARHGVHPNQVREWRGRLEAGSAGVFGSDASELAKKDAQIKELHAKVGELTMERDFFADPSANDPFRAPGAH